MIRAASRTFTSVMAVAACSGSPEMPMCEDVVPEIHRLIEIGRGAGSASPRANSTVVESGSGEFITAPSFERGTLSVFGPNGALRGVFGREGSGPGEYRDIRLVVPWLGDSIAVLDGSNGRLTIITADGAVQRTLGGLGGAKDLVPLPDGTTAVFMNSRTDRTGPIWVYGADGQIQRSFGEKAKPWLLDVAKELTTDGSFVYAASRTRFEVMVYDQSGNPVRNISAKPEWFPGITPTIMTAARPPSELTLLTDVVADSAGVLWLLVTKVVPDEAMRAKAKSPQPEQDVGDGSPAELDAISEHYIQAIDVQRNCMAPVLEVKEGVFTHFPRAGRLVSVRELEDGALVLDLWRLTLTSRSQ